VSERDLELLGLIAEQYAVTLDQLARLIGRRYRTARGLRDRWGNAGWAHSAKLAVHLPPFVWLTRQGSKLIDSPYRTWDPNPGLATHIEAVTDMRVLLERELRLGAWECERSLAQTWPSRSATRPHLPDALLVRDQRIAIEVELTLKSRARLATIIEQLSWDYDSVWYFAPERLRPLCSSSPQPRPTTTSPSTATRPIGPTGNCAPTWTAPGHDSRLLEFLAVAHRQVRRPWRFNGCTFPIELCSPSAK
jgi:hypothetical protein